MQRGPRALSNRNKNAGHSSSAFDADACDAKRKLKRSLHESCSKSV